MKSVRWMVSYILVAVVGLGLAFAVSVRFMTPAHSQGAPESGELPPEFMNEVESTEVPPPPTSSPVQGQPPQGEIPPPPMQATPQEDSVPVVAQPSHPDDYFYDPTGKRDPFKAFRAVVPNAGQKQTAALEPLQKYELDRLQIIGILWEVRTPRAMVKDPDGVVHTVVKNTRMGRNEGYVATIREGEIVVIETRYDDGKPIREPRVLEFKK